MSNIQNFQHILVNIRYDNLLSRLASDNQADVKWEKIYLELKQNPGYKSKKRTDVFKFLFWNASKQIVFIHRFEIYYVYGLSLMLGLKIDNAYLEKYDQITIMFMVVFMPVSSMLVKRRQ